MKKLIINDILVLAVGLSDPQIVKAQGTTYLSNLAQISAGSNAVGSDSWLATLFFTGPNYRGYALNSLQLAMTHATGNQSGFMVTLYPEFGYPSAVPQLGSSLGSLSGSADPAIGGIYTYTAAANIILSPSTAYFIVLTAGTAVANGAYDWSYAGTNSYNLNGAWFMPSAVGSTGDAFKSSNDGSSWNFNGFSFPQFAINATAVPEPSSEILLGLGGLGFLWHRRKIDVTDTKRVKKGRS